MEFVLSLLNKLKLLNSSSRERLKAMRYRRIARELDSSIEDSEAKESMWIDGMTIQTHLTHASVHTKIAAAKMKFSLTNEEKV